MSLSGPRNAAVSVALASELARLRREWGHCYIFRAEYGAPVAERRDTGATVRAPNAKALLKAVQDDHATNPVPECFRNRRRRYDYLRPGCASLAGRLDQKNSPRTGACLRGWRLLVWEGWRHRIRSPPLPVLPRGAGRVPGNELLHLRCPTPVHRLTAELPELITGQVEEADQMEEPMTGKSGTSAYRPPSDTGNVMLGMPGTFSNGIHAPGGSAQAVVSGHGLAGLRYVEVETARYCNRTCGWCPNGQSGARRSQELLAWSLFGKVVTELGAARFAGVVALHNYNEPLANPRLHDELDLLHTAAPLARPAIYTNGDLLKRDGLERLLSAGVKYVRVTRYPHGADIPPTEEALRRWPHQARLDEAYSWVFGPVRQGLGAWWRDDASGVLIEVIGPSIVTYNDRGGTALVPVESQPRTEPCRMTETSLSIDYRGLVKMCCNVIPDSAASHQRYVVGSVTEATLDELWNSPAMTGWRARHAVADWSDSPACQTCMQVLPETRR